MGAAYQECYELDATDRPLVAPSVGSSMAIGHRITDSATPQMICHSTE